MPRGRDVVLKESLGRLPSEPAMSVSGPLWDSEAEQQANRPVVVAPRRDWFCAGAGGRLLRTIARSTVRG